MAWMVRGTGEGLSVGAPFGWREWLMGLMVVRGRWGAREKVSWCFGCRGRRGRGREKSQRERERDRERERESVCESYTGGDGEKRWREKNGQKSKTSVSVE